MKKNKMMRLASGLLVAVLLTTSMISGTFAKYVTEDSGSDNARVAKWGVSIEAQGATFAKEYAKNDSVFTKTNSVVSTNDKVVAPGTSGTMASMKLSGTPEVAVRISYVGAFEISDNWVVNGDFYCPLVITVNGTAFDGKTFEDAEAFEDAVNGAIVAYSKDYEAGTDLSDVKTDSLKVTWEWPFSGNDANDTVLGNDAVAEDATVTLKVTTTATQID